MATMIESHSSSEVAPWTFDNRGLCEEELHEARRELYHSQRPGFVIMRNFLGSEQVQHMREIWTAPDAERCHAPFLTYESIHLGCPNFFKRDHRGNRTFFNFLWATPRDQLTHEVCYAVQMLRSRLSGHVASYELFPINGQSVSYRVVHTRDAAKGYQIEPHRDWFKPADCLNLKEHDLTRLQATLVLSQHGVDYQGDGFRFMTNGGDEVRIGADVPVEPGDLVIWRYTNQHAVTNVTCRPEQFGYLRILYPPETVYPRGLRLTIRDLALRSRRYVGRFLPEALKRPLRRILK